MSKNDPTKQFNMLKLNQTRFLTDLRFQLQALKDASADASVHNQCNEMDALLEKKIVELTQLPVK